MTTLHRVTRKVLREVISEHRSELGIIQRRLDHYAKTTRPINDSDKAELKQQAAQIKTVLDDLEKLLRRTLPAGLGEPEPTHEGRDPGHGGDTTHRGQRADCTAPDCLDAEQEG